MAQPILHYIYDPLCGWCYAASPMVAAAGVPIVLHAGGLFDAPTHVDAAKRAYMRQSDARIAQMTGVRFGPAYLDGLLADPDTVFWSTPVIAAILAAGAIRPGADLAMLKAVQHAHYVDGRRVVEAPVLRDLAAASGLDAESFEEALARVSVSDHVAASRRFMAQAGAQGFPVFLVERNGRLGRVDHERFYGHPQDFAAAIARSV